MFMFVLFTKTAKTSFVIANNPLELTAENMAVNIAPVCNCCILCGNFNIKFSHFMCSH